MKSVIASITCNQATGNRWILSTAIADLVEVYLQCCGDSHVPALAERFDKLLDDDDNSPEVRALVENLKELSAKIREAVRNHIKPFLDPLLLKPNPEKYHLVFALMMDPTHVDTLMPLKRLHQQEGLNIKTFVSSMRRELFDYVVASDATIHTSTGSISNNNDLQDSMYSDDEHETLGNSEANDLVLQQVKVEFATLRTEARQSSTAEKGDVLLWYKRREAILPKLSRFARIIFSIPPSQIDNERDFSIAGVFARARRASLSVSTLSNLLFINKNTDVASELQNIDLFTGSLESVDDEIIDEVEDFLQENNEIS
jgi:hAT family C-terminal dimerisation region